MRISKDRINKKPIEASPKPDKYSDATKYIKCAIDALGKSAKAQDSVARESIANLGVILLDLTSSN